MSKKNLLNEAQVRQFMKLACLEPLSPGFIDGLTEGTPREDIDEVRTGADPTPNLQSARRGSGRGRYREDRLEEEADAEALDDYAAGDLERGHPEEAEDDELEADAELDDEGDAGAEGGDRMISVDGLLTALEGFLEDQLDQEVEIDSTQMDLGDDEEVEMDAELGDADLEIDAEEDMELQEGEGSKWKGGEHEYKRRGKSKEHPVGHRAGEVEGPDGKKHYKTGETDDLKEEEGSKWKDDEHEYKRRGKSKKHPVGHRAGEVEGPDGKKHYKTGETNESRSATDALVEQVTKRVAARILKSALTKK